MLSATASSLTSVILAFAIFFGLTTFYSQYETRLRSWIPSLFERERIEDIESEPQRRPGHDNADNPGTRALGFPVKVSPWQSG